MLPVSREDVTAMIRQALRPAGYLLVLLVAAVVALSAPPAMAIEDLYTAVLPTKAAFPECGQQDSRACDYPLAVSVGRRYPIEVDDGVPRALAMLPSPLLSMALFDIRNGLDECPLAVLSAELRTGEQRSIHLGSTALLTVFPTATSRCFGTVPPLSASVMQLFPIWVAGKIVGWIECDVLSGEGGSCGLFVIARESKAPAERESHLLIRVSLIAPQAIERLLANLGVVLTRLLDPTFSKPFTETIELLERGGVSMDARVSEAMHCLATLSPCPR